MLVVVRGDSSHRYGENLVGSSTQEQALVSAIRIQGGKNKGILQNQLCCVGPGCGENHVGSDTPEWALVSAIRIQGSGIGWKKKRYLVELVVLCWSQVWREFCWERDPNLVGFGHWVENKKKKSCGSSCGVLVVGCDRQHVELGISWSQQWCAGWWR